MRKLALFGAMICASVGAMVMTPRTMTDGAATIQLAALIPESFGPWRVDASVVPIAPSPDVQAKLAKIYNQTFARTYINDRGQRVMLSVAYGGDQSDAMRVHLPEVCYATQGFQIDQQAFGVLEMGAGTLPVKRLVATKGPRTEPITYWIVVGEKIARTSTEQKIAQLHYALRGTVPDGMLVRVSTISRETEASYAIQQTFVDALRAGLQFDERTRFFGNPA